MDPSYATARHVDELTDVALDGLPMTGVDRVEDELLREVTAEPLTDEELADLGRIYSVSEDWHWVHGHAGLQRPLIRRLLATVRDRTWLVERYEAEIAGVHEQLYEATNGS